MTLAIDRSGLKINLGLLHYFTTSLLCYFALQVTEAFLEAPMTPITYEE